MMFNFGHRQTMFLVSLLLSSIAIISNQAAAVRCDATPGRAAFCGNLRKQSTADLERRAACIRNSFSEILDPPFDDEGKVRLCWLGSDEQICGAVNPRYLQTIHLVFVHHIEDNNGSANDVIITQQYIENLYRKLMKDSTQTVVRPLTGVRGEIVQGKDIHVLTGGSFMDYVQSSQYVAELSSFGAEIAQRVRERKFISIAHRIDEGLIENNHKMKRLDFIESIARSASNPNQCWFPLQRPALRIHLFPDEQCFHLYGSDLYEEIMADRKQITMIAASDTSQMFRWMNLWYLTYFQQGRVGKSDNFDICLR